MSRRVAMALFVGLAAGAGAARAQPEAKVQRLVAEDDGVRIEELRVRGQTQSIVVRSKTPGARPYQIITSDGARDLSQDKRAAGQRVWQVLSF